MGNHPVACAVDLLGEPPFPSVDSIRRSFHARCPAVVRCLERSGYVPSPGASSCWSFEIFGANDLHGDLDPYVDPRYARTPYIDACALPEVRHLDMPMPDRAGTLIACFRFASPDNAGGEP